MKCPQCGYDGIADMVSTACHGGTDAYDVAVCPKCKVPMHEEEEMTLKDEIKKIILAAEEGCECQQRPCEHCADGIAQSIADTLVVDEEKVDEILERVFQRGYAHGVSGGMGEDGEFYAVSDAKKAIASAKPIKCEVVS